MSSDENKLANPEYIGPGKWEIIHIFARDAIDEPSKNLFVFVMTKIRDTFRCEKCKTHLTEYMRTHPFQPFWNIKENGIEVGMSKWAHLLHNTVNKRLGKPEWDWNKYYSIYYNPNSSVCSAACLEGLPGGTTQESKPPTSQNLSITQAVNHPPIYTKGSSNNPLSLNFHPKIVKFSLKPTVLKNLS